MAEPALFAAGEAHKLKKWIMARLDVCRWVGLAVLITQVKHHASSLFTFCVSHFCQRACGYACVRKWMGVHVPGCHLLNAV